MVQRHLLHSPQVSSLLVWVITVKLRKKGLAVIFRIKKFHQYRYERCWWAFFLSVYKYDISYKPLLEHSNADGLSCLPLSTSGTQPDHVAHPFNIGLILSLPDVQKATCSDRVLSVLLCPKWVARQRLSRSSAFQIQSGSAWTGKQWGPRVIMPNFNQSSYNPYTWNIQESHCYFWSNGLNEDIEKLANSCESRQAIRSLSAAAPLCPWAWPAAPWKCLYGDFVGPFLGRTFLIIVDTHSKWPEVITTSSTISQSTIEVMSPLFSRFVLPKKLVSWLVFQTS